MEGNKLTFNSIDEYVQQFPPDVQEKLNTLRKVIKESATDAEEKISYQMPTFALRGNLVHFAAFIKIISVFTQLRVELLHLRMNYRNTKVQRLIAISDRKAASLYINKRDCQI